MKSVELEYELPPQLIAQHPANRRDHSRLLVYERGTGEVRHRRFDELPEELQGNELVVVNDTRVVPGRLRLTRPGGGAAEVLLLEYTGEDSIWEALAKPSSRLRPGQSLGPVELLEPLGEGRWRVRLSGRPQGETPLPPYITEPIRDPERYQTVYAREEGSAAAPTAGLHFTEETFERLAVRGIDVADLTLAVGAATFKPVRVLETSRHRLDGEEVFLPATTVRRLRAQLEEGGRIVAVGTTVTRALEAWARLPESGDGEDLRFSTDLFITPGFEFRVVGALLTNFHLPRSTLLMLVSAFAGRDNVLRAYEEAIREGYLFYSFGDAMLIA